MTTSTTVYSRDAEATIPSTASMPTNSASNNKKTTFDLGGMKFVAKDVIQHNAILAMTN